jgi:hypothetical protein
VLNAAIWIAGFLVLIVLAGKIPAREMEWRIIEFGFIVVWCFGGGIFLLRFVWRFVHR